MRIGIVGGGLMGLATAERLARRGHEVHVLETAHQVGGLATWHDYGPFVWDRFYHVILPTDVYLIQFIKEIGLEQHLCWRETQTGFYVDDTFHSMNNNLDFLKFPLLSLWSKFRLALTIVYCSRISDWRKLETQLVEDWLIKTSGKATYEKMWKPLLLAKLGDNYRRVSAVFIWSYIKRLFSARDSSAQKEHMGYVSGGYREILTRVVERIKAAKGKVHTGTTVLGISAAPAGGINLLRDGQMEYYDKVVFTSPVNVLRNVVSDDLVSVSGGGAGVEYLGVICMVLVTRKPLVPYYVLNIADRRIPFTGVIGMSSVVDTAETAGRYVTYLPKYVLSTDLALQRDPYDIQREFIDGIRKMFPNFDLQHIESIHVNKAVKVQPLQVLNYSTKVPAYTTRHPDFFVLNTSQFVNNTLNNNEVIRSVNEFVETYAGEFEDAGLAQPVIPAIKTVSA